uniref:Uncharacterized protein n=2 Tax=Caenorhabditis japonica TaxID=281687 RepID=A0A8R1ECT3_CAEJA
MSSRPKRLRLSCRKVCELWFPDDETNPDECDGIGDNSMVNEETEGFWEEHVENTERISTGEEFHACLNAVNIVESEKKEINQYYKQISDQELAQLHYLNSTTQSMACVNRYFEAHKPINRLVMENLIKKPGRTTHFEACAHCASDELLCVCTEFHKCEITYASVTSVIHTFLDCFAEKVQEVHRRIKSGTRTTTIKAAKFIRSVQSEKPAELKIHVTLGWDGVKISRNSSTELWPFTALCLDLEDIERSKQAANMLLGIFRSQKKPTYKIFDRIITYMCHQFNSIPDWNGMRVLVKVVNLSCDDQARRLVYNMKQFSSPGSCYHCLSQQTKIKKVDNGTILRRNVKCNVPKHLDDGLRSHGKYPKTNEMVPMWEVPLDLMHHFELGVFSRLIAEIFIETTTPLFMKIDVSEQELKDCLEIKLPSHYRALRLFFGKMTATEKGVFFMTALVRLALTNLLHPLVSLLILSLGALYTLLTSPVFQYQDIANQVSCNI